MPISCVNHFRLFISDRPVLRHLDEDAFSFSLAEFEDTFKSVECHKSDCPVVVDKTLQKISKILLTLNVQFL